MSIENPRTNTNVNRGDHVPSADKPIPQWPEGDQDFPHQRGSIEDGIYPDTDTRDEKKGFFSKTWGKVALGLTGVVAAGAAFFVGTQHGSSDRETSQAQPVATAEATSPLATSLEQSPSSTLSSTERATSSAASPIESWTPYNPNLDRTNKNTFIIEEKAYTPEQAKQELFTITQAEASTPELALAKYTDALQKGMNLNSRAETETARGGVKATQALNEEIIESGMLSNLGNNHNKVSKFATDEFVLPGTVVWETNTKNVDIGTETRTKIEGANIQTNAPGHYTVRGTLDATGYITDKPKYTNTYGAQINMKLANGVWTFPDSYFMRIKQ